jgi:dienelactone hydrolase
MDRRFKVGAMVATLLFLLVSQSAIAQEEIPPPGGGKGRVVIVASGDDGPLNYRDVARRIAALGYDVVLFDSRDWIPTQDQGLREAIVQAQRMPHALPGKVGLVGFSLGAAFALDYGTAWSDLVAVVASWYPSTTPTSKYGLRSPVHDLPAWAGQVRVPTVMFAGEDDIYEACCYVDRARAIGKAAQAAGAPFELTTYPRAKHGFVKGSAGPYQPGPDGDAFAKTAAVLRRNLN